MSLYLEILEIDCTHLEASSRCFRVTFLFRPTTFTQKQAAFLTNVNRYYQQLVTSGSKNASSMLALCRSLAISHGANASQAILGLAAQAVELGYDKDMVQANVIGANLLEAQKNRDGTIKMYKSVLDRDTLCVDALFCLGLITNDAQLIKNGIQIEPSDIIAVMAEADQLFGSQGRVQ